MARWIVGLAIAGAICAVASEQEEEMNRFGAPNPNAVNKDRFNFFDAELLEELSNQNEGNIVVSTASIKTVLALILEGSQGKTYKELQMTLRLPSNHSAVQIVLHEFQDSLHNDNSMVTMKSASRIFLSQDLSPDPRYKRLIQDYYRADIDRTNFATPELTAHNINNWIKSHTQGFIPNLIDSAAIRPDSHLILANAIFFKGNWQEEFPAAGTVIDCFYPTPDQCKKAYIMTAVNGFNYTYYAPLDSQAIQLPYQGGKYAMIILLPAMKDAIGHLNRDLSHTSLRDIINSMTEKEVMLKLPRFTIEFKTDLVPIMQNLGIQDLFSDTANLPGIIAGGKKSRVNAFLHSAKIQVNEKGTKAGAGSAASVVPLMSAYVPQFIADHPFFFYIYDQEKNTILFSGKLTSPNEAVDPNHLVEAQPLSASVPVKRPTITSFEPQSRPYPITDNGQAILKSSSISQQGERKSSRQRRW